MHYKGLIVFCVKSLEIYTVFRYIKRREFEVDEIKITSGNIVIQKKQYI